MNTDSHGSPEEERGGGESRKERDRGRGLANSGVGVEAEERRTAGDRDWQRPARAEARARGRRDKSERATAAWGRECLGLGLVDTRIRRLIYAKGRRGWAARRAGLLARPTRVRRHQAMPCFGLGQNVEPQTRPVGHGLHGQL
jgi:hypothetical protein